MIHFRGYQNCAWAFALTVHLLAVRCGDQVILQAVDEESWTGDFRHTF
jgi:hypothetical protein